MISPRTKSIAVAILLFTFSVVIINQFSSQHANNIRTMSPTVAQTNDTCYGVIFDAGSSSTKLGVYSWPCRDMVSLPDINPISVLSDKVSPGLSAFANNLTGIEGYLSPLLQKVKDVIPASKQSTTPIMLGATAGMRLLSLQDQAAILVESEKFFSTSGFYFEGPQWNRVISGQEEGIYLWIATNYLKGSIKNNTDLSNENTKTVATIDLGGASTQIAFKPQLPEMNYSYDYNVTLPENNDYTVYSISYLGYGNDQARNNVVQLSENQTSTQIFSGCFNAGYNYTNNGVEVIGTSNPAECITNIRQFLNITNCPYPQEKECSINNTYQALIPQITEIVAVSGVNAAINQFNVASPFYPEDLRLAAENFCSQDFQTVQSQDPNNQYISTKCFLGLYASTLLIDGYNVGSRLINSPSKIQGAEPTWSLGFLFNEVSNLHCADDSTNSACNNLQSIFSAFRL